MQRSGQFPTSCIPHSACRVPFFTLLGRTLPLWRLRQQRVHTAGLDPYRPVPLGSGCRVG